jgi:hypothetical protein
MSLATIFIFTIGRMSYRSYDIHLAYQRLCMAILFNVATCIQAVTAQLANRFSWTKDTLPQSWQVAGVVNLISYAMLVVVTFLTGN